MMVRGTAAALGGAVAAAVTLGACSSGQPEAQEGPTTRPVSAECQQAFAQVPTEPAELAGAAAPSAPVSPVPTIVGGAFGDLYGTVTACSSVEEWTEAFRGRRLSVTRNADPVTTLRVLCRNANAERIRSAAVCVEIELPDAPADTRDNDADLDPTESPGG